MPDQKKFYFDHYTAMQRKRMKKKILRNIFKQKENNQIDVAKRTSAGSNTLSSFSDTKPINKMRMTTGLCIYMR